MRTWLLALVIATTTMCLPSAAGEECLEVVNLGSCGPWAVGKYHKQDDEQNGKPVWHNAAEHVCPARAPSMFSCCCLHARKYSIQLVLRMMMTLSGPRAGMDAQGHKVRIVYHNDANGWWLTKHTDLGGGGYPCKQGGQGPSPLACEYFASATSCGIQLCEKEL